MLIPKIRDIVVRFKPDVIISASTGECFSFGLFQSDS
jgi:hypothetical protein